MKRSTVMFLMLAIPSACLLIFSGCETERVDQVGITVAPREAVLLPGQSVKLEASGWHSYFWYLNNPELGYLSTTTGDTATYTSIITNQALQIITVSTDVIENIDDPAALPITASRKTVQAFITHMIVDDD